VTVKCSPGMYYPVAYRVTQDYISYLLYGMLTVELLLSIITW